MISELAIIHPSAVIADDVQIGPWSQVGEGVEIGAGTVIASHVVVDKHTKIGCNNHIYQYASIGADPQDKKFEGELTFLEIGDNNVFREFCTVHRGTKSAGYYTRIGNNNLFMNYVHIAHDCVVQNDTIFANNASLAGHVTVEDFAILGAFSGVHQFCTIGAHSFLGRGALVVKDILPYLIVAGNGADPRPYGINTEGLKRRGFSADDILQLRRAYKIIFKQKHSAKDAVGLLEAMLPECQALLLLIDGIQSSKRGILR